MRLGRRSMWSLLLLNTSRGEEGDVIPHWDGQWRTEEEGREADEAGRKGGNVAEM